MEVAQPIPECERLSLFPYGKWKTAKLLFKESEVSPSSNYDSEGTIQPFVRGEGFKVPSAQKAIVTPKVGETLNMSLQTIPVREPSVGEVVVRILYSGICCSDATFSIGPQPGFPKHNHVAGHEGIGHIVKWHDSEARSLDHRLYGIRYLAWACESCTYCLRRLPTSCPFQLNTPKQIPGTFQEYVTVPIPTLLPLPDPASASAGSVDTALYAAALCSGSTALASLRAASLAPGDVLVVVGAMGAIGHLVGMIAKQVLGVNVIGVDLPDKVRRVTSKDRQSYSDFLLEAAEPHEGQAWERFSDTLLTACAALRKEQGAKGGLARAAEAVIVTSSSIAGFQRLDRYVCDGGKIVCAGVPKGMNKVSIPLHSLVERNLHLTGNLMGGNSEAYEVIEYIRTGRITPRVTKIGLEQVPQRMKEMVDCQTIGKVVVCRAEEEKVLV